VFANVCGGGEQSQEYKRDSKKSNKNKVHKIFTAVAAIAVGSLRVSTNDVLYEDR